MAKFYSTLKTEQNKQTHYFKVLNNPAILDPRKNRNIKKTSLVKVLKNGFKKDNSNQTFFINLKEDCHLLIILSVFWSQKKINFLFQRKKKRFYRSRKKLPQTKKIKKKFKVFFYYYFSKDFLFQNRSCFN